MATAEHQRAYRERVNAGLTGPRSGHDPARLPSGPVVPWRDGLAAELESTWQVAYRKAMSGWFLGLSRHTRRAYEQAWRMWSRWCTEAQVDPIEPGPGAGGAWLASMRVAGLSEQTVRLRGIAVRSALLMLLVEGLRTGGDPFFAHKFAQTSGEYVRPALSTEQVSTLIAATRDMPGRYEAAVLLCAVVGLRAVEAGQVCDESLQPSQWGMVAQVVRKGGRRALVPVPDLIVAAAHRDRWPHRADRDAAWNADAVSRMVMHAWAKSGQDGVVRSHVLRAWHVSAALEAGVPIHIVQDAVGHRDPKTTQIYNDNRNKIPDHTAFVVAGLLPS